MPSMDNAVTPFTESMIAFGSEVRQLRKARKMTQKNLAEATGVSLSHLSAIERGSVNPALDKVHRIADALGVSADWFFARRSGDGPMERAYVVRSQNRRQLNLIYNDPAGDHKSVDHLFSSSFGGDFYFGISEYHPDSAETPPELYQHEGEQHAFVLRGAFELRIEDEYIVLQEGDSYSFPTKLLHTIRNITDQPARLIWATSSVIIPKSVRVRPAMAAEEEPPLSKDRAAQNRSA